jgi:hypothetical protein
MLGLNRVGDYANGFPINLATHNFGNPVTVTDTSHIEPQPMPVGTGNILTLPVVFGNAVTWAPSPAHFGNAIPYVPPTPPSSEDDILLEDGVTTIELEDGSGNIHLEN